jgi:glycosyltransferase involved in cell wall biosynthesis
VSVVLATGRRPAWLPIAVQCYRAQQGIDAELIVVTDDNPPPAIPDASVVHLPVPTPLGAKLNAGIARARGALVCKWDDDDYYGPNFLAQMYTHVAAEWAIAFVAPYRVWHVGTDVAIELPPHYIAGGTLCFPRALWHVAVFPPVPRRVDAAWLATHSLVRRLAVPALTDAFVHVVHAGSTWTHVHGEPMERFLRRLHGARVPIDACLPAWAREAYVRADAATRGAPRGA